MEGRDMEEKKLRFLQLRFMGKILAGFTHEINNHLAIVRESAGLMSDMIRFGSGQGKGHEEYLEILGSIEEQIGKSNTHFRYLNRFSHRMDSPVSTFSINECLEELVALMRRFAGQKKMTITTVFREDLPSVTSDPSLFECLVFTFLEEAIREAEGDEVITVTTHLGEGAAVATIASMGRIYQIDETQRYIAAEIGAEVSATEKDVSIFLPIMSAQH
jgi:signal transduction histidine kinase